MLSLSNLEVLRDWLNNIGGRILFGGNLIRLLLNLGPRMLDHIVSIFMEFVALRLLEHRAGHLRLLIPFMGVFLTRGRV